MAGYWGQPLNKQYTSGSFSIPTRLFPKSRNTYLWELELQWTKSYKNTKTVTVRNNEGTTCLLQQCDDKNQPSVLLVKLQGSFYWIKQTYELNYN